MMYYNVLQFTIIVTTDDQRQHIVASPSGCYTVKQKSRLDHLQTALQSPLLDQKVTCEPGAQNAHRLCKG